MSEYELPAEQRNFIESMCQPFTVCQFQAKDVVTLAISRGFCELFGYKDREQAYTDMNQNMFKDVHPDDTAHFTNAIMRFGGEDGKLDVLYRTKKNSGAGYRVIHLMGEHVYTSDGIRLGHIWLTDEGDYSEGDTLDQMSNSDKALHRDGPAYANRYDYLTGLPNMTYFFERSEVGRKVMLDQGGLPALLYIDLDGMKHYNHRFGFSEGDRLLRYFARLLGRTFGDANCCRINADRFAAFTDENGLEERLNALFSEW